MSKVAKQRRIPKATHSGEMKFGEISIPCYVLEDGTRAISHRTLQKTLGLTENRGAVKTASLVGAISTKLNVDNDLTVRLSDPIKFTPIGGGKPVFGYQATLLAEVCKLLMRARRENILRTKAALRMADQCEILLEGFSLVGIIALVDEATGYQSDRGRDDLRKILETYVSRELARWEKTFQDEFYVHLHRLRGWKQKDHTSQKTHACAFYTADLVYDRIHPDILKELKTIRTEANEANGKLFQWLSTTPNGGHPRLKQHLEGVITLMAVAQDWEQFSYWIDRRYPRHNETRRLPFQDMDRLDIAQSAEV